MSKPITDKNKKAFRGLLFSLLYGGIVTVIGTIIGFCLRLSIDYSFYKEEGIWIFLSVCEWIAYLVLFGVKYVMNQGYIDDFDHVHYISSYFRNMSLVFAFKMIPVLLSGGAIGAIFSYIVKLCYAPEMFVANVFNNIYYNAIWYYQTEMSMYWMTLAGVLMMSIVDLFAFIPFYYLGKYRRHCDLKNGVYVKVCD